MAYLVRVLGPVSIAVFTGCNPGVRELDFIDKQFQATYNLDSTRTIDSTRLAALRNAKAVYAFSEGGKGVNHIRIGMVSSDIPFTWSIRNDSLTIGQAVYSVRKENKGFVLFNDSVKLMFSQHP